MPKVFFMEIAPGAGINRDGTKIDTELCTDGTWTRFYDKRPKKMGGYKLIDLGNNEIPRSLYSYDSENSILLYVGRSNSLEFLSVFPDLTASSSNVITPFDFAINPKNIWSITTVPAIVDETPIAYLVATAAPNGSDISNAQAGQVYYTPVGSTDALQPIPNIFTTGGVLNLGPYLIVYDLNGYVIWNDGSDIELFPDDNFLQIGSSKFVAGAPVRTGNVVSGLLWSLDGVVSLTLNPAGDSPGEFVASYISTISTILSSGCVISYEPYFFWIGINTFYMYNGSVMEVPNTTNKLWFFQNLNQDQKQKVVGFVNKKYGELCWLFPYGDSVENNWMLIYNINTQQWYDTNLINRASAVSSTSQMQYPIMASSSPEVFNGTSSYPLWAHEYGVNRIDPVRETALYSSFTTNKLWLIDQQPESQVLIADTFIPDIVMEESMFFTIDTQGYPNSTPTTSPLFSISPSTEFSTVRQKGSIISMTFTSNVLNGDYLFGKSLMRFVIADDQRPGPSST